MPAHAKEMDDGGRDRIHRGLAGLTRARLPGARRPTHGRSLTRAILSPLLTSSPPRGSLAAILLPARTATCAVRLSCIATKSEQQANMCTVRQFLLRDPGGGMLALQIRAERPEPELTQVVDVL